MTISFEVTNCLDPFNMFDILATLGAYLGAGPCTGWIRSGRSSKPATGSSTSCEGLAHGSPVLGAHKYYFVSSAKARDARWEIAVKLLRCIEAFIQGERIDPAHIYVSEQAIAYFADAHPDGTTFGQLYAARAPLAKGGVKEKA